MFEEHEGATAGPAASRRGGDTIPKPVGLEQPGAPFKLSFGLSGPSKRRQPAPVTYKGNNNRVDQWVYDAAGNVLNDTNSGYEYDAEGRRAMKVLVSGFGTPQATTTVENEYLLGLEGEQVSVLGATGHAVRMEQLPHKR